MNTIPDGYEVKIDQCKMCNGTGKYEIRFDNIIKCKHCTNGKYAILVPKEAAEKGSQKYADETYAQHHFENGFIAGANHIVDELKRWAKSHSPTTPSALLNKLEQFKQEKP